MNSELARNSECSFAVRPFYGHPRDRQGGLRLSPVAVHHKMDDEGLPLSSPLPLFPPAVQALIDNQDALLSSQSTGDVEMEESLIWQDKLEPVIDEDEGGTYYLHTYDIDIAQPAEMPGLLFVLACSRPWFMV